METAFWIVYVTGVLMMIALPIIHAYLIDELEQWNWVEIVGFFICCPFSWIMAIAYLMFMLHDLVKRKRTTANQSK
jgi:hypothetical protein